MGCDSSEFCLNPLQSSLYGNGCGPDAEEFSSSPSLGKASEHYMACCVMCNILEGLGSCTFIFVLEIVSKA